MHVLRRPVEIAVDSRRLGKSYLELVPRSHYGGKAVVPGYREPSERRIPVSQLSAISSR